MYRKRQLIKLGALLLAVLLAAVAAPKPAPADSGTQYVRVLLSTSGATTLTIPVSGSYTLTEASRSFTGGTLTITGSGTTVTATHSSEGTLYSGKSLSFERQNLSRTAGHFSIKTSTGTRQYLGHFKFTASGGVLQVVNRVPLSHYLYGVVAYEMSDNFPLEALKAQAVAAKGYALLQVKSTGSYDIGDTATDQVYRGYVADYTNVIHAVDSTAADVLYYNGKVLQCYYAASNGGWAILPGTRWSSKLQDGAFIEGADSFDMRNPYTPRETVFVSSQYAQQQMGTRAFAFIDSRLLAVVGAAGIIPKDYHYAGVKSIDAVQSSGQAGYKGDLNHTTVTVNATIIVALDDAVVPTPTPAHDPTPSPTPPHEATPSPTPEHVPAAPPEGGDPEAAEDPTPSPTPTHAPTPSPTPAHKATPSPTPEPEFTREIPISFSFNFSELVQAGLFTQTNLSITYAEPANGGFNLIHARYGHGVGMSQRGAQQMAAEGLSYQMILAYYYPGATLGAIDYVFPENMGISAPETATPAAGMGTVQGASASVRNTASNNGAVIETLSAGTTLFLLGMQGEWYYVQTLNNNLGYLHHNAVLLSGSTIIATGVSKGSAVNYRMGPGTGYDSIGKLSNGTQLGIYGMVDGWYKVKAMTTGQTGFIRQDYVTLSASYSDSSGSVPMPVLTPPPTEAPPTPTPAPSGSSGGSSALPPPPTGNFAATGFINASAVNIRAGASTATKSYAKLAKNTQLDIFEKVGSWYLVQVTSTGQTGYVYGSYVSLNNDVGGAAYESGGAINASGVNIRKGASTAYTSLGKLSKGTKLVVLGSSGSWYRVRVVSSGAEGYVFAKYVTLGGQVSASMTVYGAITARLNLRTTPSTGSGSRVLLVMPKGAIVTVYSIVNGWAYVNYEGTSGYCISSCVKTG